MRQRELGKRGNNERGSLRKRPRRAEEAQSAAEALSASSCDSGSEAAAEVLTLTFGELHGKLQN